MAPGIGERGAMRLLFLALALLFAAPAAACALHAGLGMGAIRYGGFGLFDHEETADDIPRAALEVPLPSREEALAALRAQLLVQAPALRPEPAQPPSALAE